MMKGPGSLQFIDPYPWQHGITCRRPDFSIHIVRDLSTPANPSVQNHSHTHPGTFVIHLAGKDQALHPNLQGATEIDCVLHELGHVIGLIGGLPGALGDPRNNWTPNQFQFVGDETPGQRVWRSEVEAWTLAESMLLACFQSARRRALATYEHYREVPQWLVKQP